MSTKNVLEMFWSDEDDSYIAVDPTRPGCSAVGNTQEEAFKELQDARKAWDGAKLRLHKI